MLPATYNFQIQSNIFVPTPIMCPYCIYVGDINAVIWYFIDDCVKSSTVKAASVSEVEGLAQTLPWFLEIELSAMIIK